VSKGLGFVEILQPLALNLLEKANNAMTKYKRVDAREKSLNNTCGPSKDLVGRIGRVFSRPEQEAD
jgi:hypothetical protein